ncbi:MAG: hypothetical protein HDS16_05175 [Bacteroides sp.]|nr:hypothetical protein [Bacteroides sp.]
MANLGSLYYTLGLRDLTDADLQKINKKLESAGATITVNPVLAKSINDILPKGVDVEIRPNKVAQEALDRAVEGKAIHAEILPLVDKLKSVVVDALKNTPASLDGITIAPDKLNTAITNALTSANFASIGDKVGEELAKSIKVKVEGQKYDATITAKTDKLADTINKTLDKIFGKEQKIKLERSGLKTFRDELKRTIGESIKVTPTLNVTQEALQKAVEGKVMRVEVIPLLTHLRKTLKDATTSNPLDIEVGVQEAKLRNIIQNVLNKQGFMLNISSVNDNYSKTVQQNLNGRIYTVKIHADAKEISRSIQASLMNVQSRTFSLTVSKDILRNSIDQALMGKPFNIQIAVMQDQARRAVQNALNNARMVGKDDALAYQRLKTGELRAAQTELARLKAAQHGAAEAAKAHASASINLGGALGSNIKIAGELGAAMASLYSIHAAKQFLSQVIEIGGELEHQKIALETIYGTESKMESLYGQIKGLARQSPFGVMELTKNVKQLSAYGVAYNEVYDTAKRLADISAATSVDIQRLILAFGKTKNRTFLDGLEAKQFAYANIPIYDMLSKKLTELEGKFVSVKDVMGRIKKREIGFDMVKDILWDMTDEGGKFYNMQEKLAGSVKTSWKLVRDNIELMFGEIAEGKVGSGLKGIAQVLQGITREWKVLSGVIGSGVAVWGVAKMASLLMARSLDATGASALKAAANSALLERRNARLAAGYKNLTAEEQALLSTRMGFWSRQKSQLASLTSVQFQQLALSKKISKAEWERMIALNRLSDVQKKILVQNNVLTQTELNNIRVLTGWQRAFLGVGNTARSFGRSLLSLVANPMTIAMTAVGFAVGWIAKWREEVKKAREAADSFTKKGMDGFEDLIKQSKELNSIDPSKLSAPQLASRIEEMKTTLKDYSLTAQETFDKVFSTGNNGKIRSQKEQFEMLRDAVNETAEAYRNMKNGEKSQIFKSDKSKEVETLGEKASKASITTSDEYTNLLKYSNLLDDVFEKIQINKNKAGEYLDIDKDATSKLQEQLKLADTLDEKLKIVYSLIRNEGTVYAEDDGVIAGAINQYILRLIQQKEAEDKVTSAMRQKLQELKNIHKAQNAAWNPSKSNRQAEEYLQEAKAFAEASEKMTSAQKEQFMDLAYESIGKLSPRIREIREEVEKMVKTMQVSPDQFGLTNEMLEYVKLVEHIRALPQEQQSQMIAEYEKLDPAKYVLLSDDVATDSERYMNQIKESLIKSASEKYPELSDYIRKMIESDEFTAYVQLKLQYGSQESFMQQFHNLAEWQQNLLIAAVPSNEIRDEIAKALGSAETVSEAAEALRKLRKEADAVIQNEGAILLKIRPTLDLSQPFNPRLFDNEDPVVKQVAQNVNNAINKLKASENALNAYGLPLTDPTKGKKGKKGSKGSQKDPFADAIRERIKILKEAKKEYEDLAKSIGTDAAFNELKDSPIFAGLKANEFLPEQAIPQTLADYKKSLDELQEKLTAKGLKTQKHRELNIEIEKVKFEIRKKETEDALKLALDKVSKEAERQIADWNLFDKIRKATGNQDLAMSIAFGMNATAETDYQTMIKEQFKKASDAAESALSKVIPKDGESPYEVQGYNYEKLKELYDARSTDEGMQAWMTVPEEIRKAWEKANGDIVKYFDQQREAAANILTEYQDLQDKLDAIEAKRKSALEAINAKREDGSDVLSDEERERKTKLVNTQADYDKFTQSNEYLRFFNDIYGLTLSEANKIGDLIQLNLNQKLQAGLITIYDYEKEMEKVRKQLEAIRNVKSNAMTFLTGGVKGLNEKRLREEEGKLANNENYQKALKEQIAAQEILNKARESGNEEEVKAAEEQLKLANESLKVYTAVRDAIIKDQEKWQGILDVTNGIANIAGGISDAFNTLRDMADAYGFDSDSNAWNTAGAVIDTLSTVTNGAQKVIQSAMNGDIGGMISGTFDTLLTPFTIWSQLHDKKLQKMIERSKEAAQIMQNQYDILEKRMANFLGNAALMNTGTLGGGYGKQRELMQGQLAELEKQRQAEIDKKKTDNSVVEDYNQQIEEMKIAIRDFALEVANDLYGIDLNGWAEQLGDTLVEAFARGEDAGEAFDKKVGEILRSISSKMISQDILAPMFGDLRDFLFGKNGTGGAFGSDFQLDPSEMGAMKEYLDKIKNEGIPAAQELFDAINEATGGMLNDTEKSKDGMTKGLQSLTENTGDLLASYVNGIRGDTSVIRLNWDKLMESTLPQMNVIAEAQLTAQRQIAENTLRTAEAAELLVKSNAELVKYSDKLERSWRRIAERNWGTY